MIVIKLGGSLMASGKLRQCLDKIDSSYQGKAVIIVPGGGVFADQVRYAQQQWQFHNRAAHCMAILAMQQMALLVNALKPSFKISTSIAEIRELIRQANTLVWSPDVTELDKANIASTWDITSDSLSAWLAKALGADELILVKSVNIDCTGDVRKLAKENIVDTSFFGFVQQSSFNVRIINAEEFLS
jgi:aspartokinase-like uncharacterized kinase